MIVLTGFKLGLSTKDLIECLGVCVGHDFTSV